MNKKKVDSTPYGSDSSSLKFWSTKRNKLNDLYKSEKYFFLNTVKKSNSFLDIGCAAGGFSKIIYKLKKKFNYSGLDVSVNMIEAAKKNNKECKFYLYNGKDIPKKLSNKDLVFSFGTLHHSPHAISIISQMIKKSNKYVLFDLRFKRNLKNRFFVKNFQKINFLGKLNKNNQIPYYILNFEKFKKKIMNITKKKFSIEIYGYKHKPNKNTITKYKSIIMASILIDKSKSFKLVSKII